MTRKIYLLIILFSTSLFIQKAIAQNQEIRCSTFEFNQQLKKANPDYAAGVAQNEKLVTQWIKDHPNYRTRGTVTIPVVIHLIYNPDSADQKLSDWQISSEIDVMNEDYIRQNADAYRTPDAFTSIAADCDIQFCLAQRDPNGNPTTGIVRVPNVGLTYFHIDEQNFPDEQQWMKSSSTGGDNGWPYQNYLNIWVVPLEPGYLGYSTLPFSDPASYTAYDGCVCHYKAFGRINTKSKTYNLGRTATHEAGHWLDMIHVWGDDGGLCMNEPGGGSDSCADTPDQSNYTFGCPSFPLTDHCSPNYPGVAYNDYMDYTNDSGMNMFTNDQKERMWANLNTSRLSIQSSNGCNSPTPYAYDIGISAITQPIMTYSKSIIDPTVTLSNFGTNTVTSATIYYSANYKSHLYSYNWTGSLAPGSGENVNLPEIPDSLGQQIFIAYSKNPNGQADADTTNDFRTRSYYANYKIVPIQGDRFSIYNAENPNVVDLNYHKIILKFDTLSVGDINQYQIISILGQTELAAQLTNDKISANELELDVSSLPTGLYFIRVKMASDIMVQKILIIR